MKALIITILIPLTMLFSSCARNKLPDPMVRFENIMVDRYEFPYGLIFGDALYAGSLGFMETTPYMETTPGTYSVLARRVDGEWIVISEGQFNVWPGLSYTIRIFGTVERFSFQLKED